MTDEELIELIGMIGMMEIKIECAVARAEKEHALVHSLQKQRDEYMKKYLLN